MAAAGLLALSKTTGFDKWVLLWGFTRKLHKVKIDYHLEVKGDAECRIPGAIVSVTGQSR